jgi:surface antigen
MNIFICILISLFVVFFFIILDSEYYNYKNNKEKVIGKTKEGIISYYNDNDNDNKDKGSNYCKHNNTDIYTGLKWECVEFVRRYLILTKGITFEDVGNALDILKIKYFYKINLNTPVKPFFIRNDNNIPEIEDIIIISDKTTRTGHVAIVSDISDSKIHIIEQNYDNKEWGDKNYSRDFYVDKHNSIKIKSYDSSETILGWVRIY